MIRECIWMQPFFWFPILIYVYCYVVWISSSISVVSLQVICICILKETARKKSVNYNVRVCQSSQLLLLLKGNHLQRKIMYESFSWWETEEKLSQREEQKRSCLFYSWRRLLIYTKCCCKTIKSESRWAYSCIYAFIPTSSQRQRLSLFFLYRQILSRNRSNFTS